MLVVTTLLCGASALDRPARPAGHRGGAGRRRRGPDRRRPRRRALAGPVPAGGRLAAALVGGVLRRPRGGRRAARPADPDDGDLAAGRPARRPAAAVPAAHRRAVHRPGGRGGRAGRRGGRRRHRATDPPGTGADGVGARRHVRRPRVPSAGWRWPPGATPLESWSATAVLAVGRSGRRPARAPAGPRRASPSSCPRGVGLVVGTALALSLRTAGDSGLLVAAGIGLALLVAAVLTVGPDRRHRPAGRRRGGGDARARRACSPTGGGSASSPSWRSV